MNSIKCVARMSVMMGLLVASAAAHSALINDGGFENGPPPASAWTETSSTSCEWIGDWSGSWGGVAAFQGSYDFWAGGYCGGVPTTNSVAQSVLIPAASPLLTFYYLAYRPDKDDPDLDKAYVSINGSEVWMLNLTQTNNTYPNWTNAVVDLSSYGGQTVTLAFGAISQGSRTGNIRFDAIGLDARNGQVPEPATLMLMGIGLAGFGALRIGSKNRSGLTALRLSNPGG